MHGPDLTGPSFLSNWGSQTAAALYEYVRAEMPPGLGGSLPSGTYLSIVAYLLQVNGHAAGPQALTADAAAIVGEPGAAPERGAPATADASDAASADEPRDVDAVPALRAFVNREVSGFTPVTDELLRNPSAEDWLTWRRTRDNQGYTPLDRIGPDNVAGLRLAWALAMPEGTNQTAPLVHDGVMFLASPGNVVQALDAATGELLWEHRHQYPDDAESRRATRSIALYRDKVYLATYDAAIVALDARTGEPVWQTTRADYRKGFAQTGGPSIANGVVVSGINGCERFEDEGCFITGHDPDTGEELWRTSTIAQPGDVNSGTWGDIPPHLRGGGDTWIPGAYDADLDLFFIGTAQAKPWVAASRGMSTYNDALYTNSTLALNPHTGQVAWYFQHVPGETWSWPSSAHRLRPCSATPTATPSRRRSRDVHDGLDRDEKRRPRAVHSRASAGTRSWSWFKYYDRAVVEVPRDVDRLDPAGVVRLLPGGDVAVAPDQADAGMSRA